MKYIKKEINSNWVGGRHQSAILSFEGDVTKQVEIFYKVNLLKTLERNQCLLVIAQKKLKVQVNSLKTVENPVLKQVIKLATNVIKTLGRALKTGIEIKTAATLKNHKAILSSKPDAETFYHTSERIYLGRFLE